MKSFVIELVSVIMASIPMTTMATLWVKLFSDSADMVAQIGVANHPEEGDVDFPREEKVVEFKLDVGKLLRREGVADDRQVDVGTAAAVPHCPGAVDQHRLRGGVGGEHLHDPRQSVIRQAETQGAVVFRLSHRRPWSSAVP